MAEGTVEERVKTIIVDELGVDEGEVTPNARFIDDLGQPRLYIYIGMRAIAVC